MAKTIRHGPTGLRRVEEIIKVLVPDHLCAFTKHKRK